MSHIHHLIINEMDKLFRVLDIQIFTYIEIHGIKMAITNHTSFNANE